MRSLRSSFIRLVIKRILYRVPSILAFNNQLSPLCPVTGSAGSLIVGACVCVCVCLSLCVSLCVGACVCVCVCVFISVCESVCAAVSICLCF